jgi:multidrug resistance efflux pump
MGRKVVLPLLAMALLGWAVWNVFGAQRTKGDVREPAAPPRSPYVDVVAGAGLVEPRTESSGTATVAVGSELAGVVAKVFVKVGQQVKEGDPLFALDDRAKQAELALKKANQEAAEKQLTKLELSPRPEEVPPLRAKLEAAKAALRAAADALSRAERAGRAVSPEELYQKRQARDMAQEAMEQAQKNLDLLLAGAWGPDKDIARAAVAQAKAAVAQVETDLKRLVVRAPVTGAVLQLNVRPGEAVDSKPGQALVMMGDVSVLHVRVSIDESDIARFKPEALAEGKTRGSPQKVVPLKFVRVEPYVVPKKSLTGDNSERVDTRVLQVIFAIDMPNAPVYVGQQLDVFVNVASAKEVVKPASYPQT